MNTGTALVTSRTLRRLVETARDASRAVGRAENDHTQSLPDYRSLLDHEEKAINTLETFLTLHGATPPIAGNQGDVVRDFYLSLHGDNGLSWQIRAQQAIGRREVPIDISGHSWQRWASIRVTGLDDARQEAR